MQIVGPAPEALSNADIIARYPDAIKQVLKSCADPEYDSERIIQINNAKRLWQFVRGMQFGIPGLVDGINGEIVDYVAMDGDNGQEGGAADKLCPVVNFIGGDLYKYMAVMGQNAPAVKGVADDPEDPESMDAGRNADVNIRDLWIKNRMDRKWRIAAFHQYVTGPCFVRGIWNTDAVKYGQSIEPKIEVETSEDGLPMPSVVGEQAYANGDAEVRFHSILEVSLPFMAQSLEEADWLKCELMMSKWALLRRFADSPAAAKLQEFRDGDLPDDDNNAAMTTATDAREATANPSGASHGKKTNQWRFSEHWASPSQFEAIKDDEARDVFNRQFSDGLYVAKVGSVTVEIDSRKKTDEWTVIRIGRGEKIMERPIAADFLPIQSAINDLFGMAIETVLRAITQTIMDQQLIDRKAMSTNEAIPAEIIPTAMPVDSDLRARIFQIPPARLSDQVLPLLDKLRQAGQDITGIRPELSGGGQPTQTFREAKQRKDQALLQLAPQADEMRYASEDIARILVTLRSKYGSGTVKAQRKGAYGPETDVSDMADLKNGLWHAESDDQFPMTLSDRRDAVYSMLKEFPPEVQQALSILDPINIEEIFELLQIPGFESAVLQQKEKTLSDIKQLLAGQSIDGPPGPDGQPGPKQPSVPVADYDDHAFVSSFLARWQVSPTGQKEAIRNPAGFENVDAFRAAQKVLATPPPPPPPPPVKAGLNLSAKLEDFPNLVNEVLQGAGLPPQQPPPPPPAPAPPPPAPGDMGHPGPVGSPDQEVPLDAVPMAGPQGPAVPHQTFA